MTQAFNLSQLANNLNTSGQLDATDGLVGVLPQANGGTGATALSSVAVTSVTGGTGISVSSSTGAVTITNTAGGVTSLNGATGALTGWQNIATGTFSASTAVNITNLATGYKAIQLIFLYKVNAGSSPILGFRYSTNNGSSYVATNYQLGYIETVGATLSSSISEPATYIPFYASLTLTTTSTQNLNLIFNQTDGTRPSGGTLESSVLNVGAGTGVNYWSNFNLNTTSYINAFQIVRTSGSATITGSYTVLGVK